jgi:hypothetical protein
VSSNWRDTYATEAPYVGYDDYVDPTRPDPANYLENPDQYDIDLAAWAATRNGDRAFALPTSTPYTRDDGSQGNWYTAGTTREETGGEYWANYLNNKWLSKGGNPTGLDYIGLRSWLSLHPEEAQQALMAVDLGTGSPLLDRGLIDWMLNNGMSMPNPPAAPGTPGQGPGGLPDPGTPGGPSNPDMPAVNLGMDGYSQWTPSEDGTRFMNVAGWTATKAPDGSWMYVPPTYGTPWSNPGNPNGPTPMTDQQYRTYVLQTGPQTAPSPSPVAPAQPGVPDAQRYNNWYNGSQPYGMGATGPSTESFRPTAAPQPNQTHEQLVNWFAKRRNRKWGGRPV